MPFAARLMVQEMIILNEVSHTEKEISYHIAYMQNLKNDKNKSILQNRNRFKDLENELWLPGDKILGGEG